MESDPIMEEATAEAMIVDDGAGSSSSAGSGTDGWWEGLSKQSARALELKGVCAVRAMEGLFADGCDFVRAWTAFRESGRLLEIPGALPDAERCFLMAAQWMIEEILHVMPRTFLVGLQIPKCCTEKDSMELRTVLLLPPGHPSFARHFTGGAAKRQELPRGRHWKNWVHHARPNVRRWLIEVSPGAVVWRRCVLLRWSERELTLFGAAACCCVGQRERA